MLTHSSPQPLFWKHNILFGTDLEIAHVLTSLVSNIPTLSNYNHHISKTAPQNRKLGFFFKLANKEKAQETSWKMKIVTSWYHSN